MDRNTACVLAVGQQPWHSLVGFRNVDPLAADGVPLDVGHAVHVSAPRRTHQYRYRKTSVNKPQSIQSSDRDRDGAEATLLQHD